MAYMLKKILEKKKRDAKFKLAGPGHKLSDEKPPEEAAAATVNTRSEPCADAKQAGRAALARLAACSSITPGFNTPASGFGPFESGDMDPAQRAYSGTRASSSEEMSPLLAVQGVFYRCPLIGPEVLTKEEWRRKIRVYLYEQLEQERGIIACLIIHSCNKNKEKVQMCIETLKTYLENIVANPTEEKFHRIRVSNRIFQDRIVRLEGAMDFLLAAGFESKKLPFKEVEEDYLVYNSEKSDVENLKLLLDALRDAEPIGIELDRNTQVLLPSQAAARVQLPNDFYKLTPDEIKREQQMRTVKLENSMQLKTKAMREKEEQREVKKYRYSVIRIRFPNGVLLQGTFSVYEKFRAIREFVMENLEVPGKFLLSTGFGLLTETDEESSLLDLRLVPATMLSFSWDSEEKPSTYLKEAVMEQIQQE